MRLFVLSALFATTTLAAAVAADMPAGHPAVSPAPQGANAALEAKHSGTVSEVFAADPYVYVHVKGDGGDEWLAGPKADIKVGATVRWNDGTVMTNFNARSMNRTLDKVRFVEVLELVAGK